MNRVSLTMPTAARPQRARAAGLALTLLAAAGSLALALLLPALWPLAIGLAALLTLAWLMHTQPMVPHVEYFSADEDGLRYAHADGRTVRYKWTEILEVAAARGGLKVETGRGAQKGATVFLPMPSAADCQAASKAAADWLAAYRL